MEETTRSEHYFRRTKNFSHKKLQLKHTIPLPIRTLMNLTFTLPDNTTPINITNEIVSTTPPEDLHMDMKFMTINNTTRAQIDTFLNHTNT